MSKLNAAESAAFHRNTTLDGRTLAPSERERFLDKYLPSSEISSQEPSPVRRQQASKKSPPTNTAQLPSRSQKQRRKPIRTFAGSQLHLFIYNVIHLFFGIYVRLRRTYRAVKGQMLAVLFYHHRTPELIQKDVKALVRVPEHLSMILPYREDEGLDGLVNDVAEIAAWCASAQIPMLSIYEKSGILKSYLPQTHRAISRNLHAYFGSSHKPTVSLRAPQMPTYSPPTTPLSPFPESEPFHINILIISESDGRETIVDLTKTLSEMSQHGKLTSKEVTSEVIDAELREGVMDEPDLLILFGERVKLEGYPPWQVRLTEIFHVPDNTEGVSYQVFLQALHRYAKAQMRFGR